MRRFPLHAYATCAVLLIGCQSADPISSVPSAPPPPSGQSLSLEISGPSQIDAKGSFSWEAFAFGGSGAYQYEWIVTSSAGEFIAGGTERELSLVVTGNNDFLLTLTVSSGGQERVESLEVTNCIGGCAGSF